MKTQAKLIVTTVLVLLPVIASLAQSEKTLPTRVNVVFGLNQLLAKGFNVEGNVFYKRLALDYSHGVSLDFTGSALTGAVKDQKLAVHLPYTTGFGVGYRFNKAFNIRVEPKWHRFEIYYDGDGQNTNNRITAYTTFTLGLGAYYNWQPFANSKGIAKGFVVVPSVRFWPKLSSTLKDDQFIYQNKVTGKQEVHKSMEVGFGNTPWVLNISVGYSFGLNKR